MRVARWRVRWLKAANDHLDFAAKVPKDQPVQQASLCCCEEEQEWILLAFAGDAVVPERHLARELPGLAAGRPATNRKTLLAKVWLHLTLPRSHLSDVTFSLRHAPTSAKHFEAALSALREEVQKP